MGSGAGAALLAVFLMTAVCRAEGENPQEAVEQPPAGFTGDAGKWKAFRAAHPHAMSTEEQLRLFEVWNARQGDGATPEDQPEGGDEPGGNAPGARPAPARQPAAQPEGELEVPPALSPGGDSPAAGPGASPRAQDRGRARAKAQDMGKALEQNPSEEDPGGGARPKGPAAPKPGPGSGQPPAAAPSDLRPGAPPRPAAAKSDPANPVTQEDLRLAAVSFKEPFREMGLAVAPKSDHTLAIVHDDGRPATGAEVARLKERIRREPEALRQYPAMFNTIPRRQYEGLKDSYSEPGPAAAQFRDIGLTASDRDFQWNRSCDRVSGSCNENAGGSYQKGALVDPADLARISKRLTELSRGRGEAARPASHGIGAGSGLSGLLSRMAGAFGKAPDPARDSEGGMPMPADGPGRSMPRPDDDPAVPVTGAPRFPAETAESPLVAGAGASIQTAPPSLASAARAPERGIPIWPGISAFGLVLIGLALWKRKD